MKFWNQDLNGKADTLKIKESLDMEMPIFCAKGEAVWIFRDGDELICWGDAEEEEKS